VNEVTAPAAQLAKAALRRLALARLEPTPENYAQAYAAEMEGRPATTAAQAAAAPPASAQASPPAPAPAAAPAGPPWPALVGRLARNLERGGKQWTMARRKESLHRVLDSSRGDEARLAQRLHALMQSWESDRAQDSLEAIDDHPSLPDAAPAPGRRAEAAGADLAAPPAGGAIAAAQALGDAVRVGLGDADERSRSIGQRLQEAVRACAAERSADPAARDVARVSGEAERWFAHRHEVVRQLGGLCHELIEGLAELSEDASYSRGQCAALRVQMRAPLELRSLRAASALLADTRARQATVQREREAARSALKELIAGMVNEVGALQQQTGGFESQIERHAAAVAAAESLEDLTAVVQAMLADSRRVRAAVASSHQRLREGAERAAGMEVRLRELESELSRISDQAHTDALTQVANRRGLDRLFEQECAHAQQAGAPLAVALLDIDNFKRLNDRLGHSAGDAALKALAASVRERLRPQDQVARFGGEEFVVLLRGLSLNEAQQALTRLQRGLSASLFMHEGEEVFVTFSAGVAQWQPGESLQACIERADGGLYEAKRTGKNRTCAA
jgi:diguanylate cyclase